MTLEIGFRNELTNTQYAPLAVLCAHYQQHHILDPLTQVQIPMRERDFSPADKLIQILLGILAGCETLAEVNVWLKLETKLAAIWGWPGWADTVDLVPDLGR
jgi:hypothetical protein